MSDIIEDLKGDRPKLFGLDYYNMIYVTAFFLSVSMIFVYFSVEDPKLQKMVLMQGFLSIGLMASLMYYQKRLEKRKLEDAKRKQQKEEYESAKAKVKAKRA